VCKCTPNQVERYLSRISGPLIDRIDIHIDVPAVSYDQLASDRDGVDSVALRQQVIHARRIQAQRFAGTAIFTNAQMSSRLIRRFCKLDESSRTLLKQAVYELGLSARAHDKVLKIARTIADLDAAENIQTHHIAEAIQYRRLDRKL
jgi:magnesium chelatase family protein